MHADVMRSYACCCHETQTWDPSQQWNMFRAAFAQRDRRWLIITMKGVWLMLKPTGMQLHADLHTELHTDQLQTSC